MATKQDVEIRVGVQGGAETESALGRIAQAARNLKRENSLSGERALGSFLNRGAGGVGELGLSALGLGAAGMVTRFAAQGIEHFAEVAGKLKEELASGAISAGDIAERMLSATPILGEIWSSGRAIREAFTGTAEQLKLINEEAK